MPALKKIASATVAVLTLVSLSACNSAADKQQKASRFPSSGVVQKVNGVPITRTELDRAVRALLVQSRMPDKIPAETLKQATEAALNQLTAAELLYQEASKLEIKDLDKLVATKIAQSKFQYPSQAEFDKALQSVGMTQKAMEEAARKDMVINNFIEKRFAPQATITEEEVHKFYEDNKQNLFSQGERIKVSHILIAAPEKASAESKQQAKLKAQALLKRVRAGENFAALAKAESSSPTKQDGGELGILGKGQTMPAFEKAAFALQAGEVSGVVETPLGYHIIKVDQRLAPATESYKDVKQKIVANLKREKIRKAVAQLVEQLRAKAKIEKA
jgi:peptidyl-prolyl cis-trans isomerase C